MSELINRANRYLDLWDKTTCVEIEVLTGMNDAREAYYAAPDLVRELVEYGEGWRENYRGALSGMLANARVIGQLRDECGLTDEYVNSLVDTAIAEARAT